MTTRQTALTEPPENLTDFPSDALADRAWRRAHSMGTGPWWFASSGDGRFDLPPPHGTCYLASAVAAAVRERLGPTLASAGMVSVTEADRMVVSQLAVEGTAADATDQHASDFGVTLEIGTITPYELPQRWAAALHTADHDGILYWPRFSTDAQAHALALFGLAGAADERHVDQEPLSGRDALEQAGIRPIELPRDMPTIDPPTSKS